ncbi:MAG TPA: ABC transporter permease [Stellaceae bacterium]|nr:ABC transporter permease [Stellaceae bacterium]
MATFLRCLSIQSRVIGALVMRELQTRYGRDNLGFLWLMGEPLMFAGGVLVLWRLLRGEFQQGVPVISFTLLGYVPLLLFRHTVGRVLNCLKESSALLYHRPVTLLDVILARIFSEIAGNILTFAFAFAVLFATGLMEWPTQPALVFLGYFYMAWFTTGVGLVLGCLSDRSELVEKFWTPLSYLFIPLSGAYYLAAWVTDTWRDYYLLLPTVSAYELIRAGFLSEYVRSYWDQPYIAFWSACPTLLGLYLARSARYHFMVR